VSNSTVTANQPFSTCAPDGKNKGEVMTDSAAADGPDEGTGRPLSHLREAFATLGPQAYLFLVLGAVLVVGSALSPFFLTERNLLAVLITASVVSVLAVGQLTVIVTGGIDLSVGSVAALSSVVAALLMRDGQPFLVAVIAALAVGAFIGLVNGVLVVHARITPFIVTLAMLSIARGLAYIVQTERLIPISNTRFLDVFVGYVGPIPTPILIALVVMVVAAIVMAGMPFGRRLYAIGGNAEAARLSGLPVKRDVTVAYVISGLLAGLAGLLIAAQLTEGSAIIGEGYELNAIAAVVVGGASLFGGTGNPVSAVVGCLIMGSILNIMDLRGVQAQPQLVVKGTVIIVAVFFTSGIGSQLLGWFFSTIGGRVRPRRARETGDSASGEGAE
jgi:ribose transport system permease protein